MDAAVFCCKFSIFVYVGHGGSVVGSVPCVRRITGLSPTLAATYGTWQGLGGGSLE